MATDKPNSAGPRYLWRGDQTLFREPPTGLFLTINRVSVAA